MRIVLALMTFTASALAQQPAQPQRTPAALDRLLSRIVAYEHGQSRAALAELTLFINGSLGAPVLLRTLESRLLAFLQSNATPAAKAAVARELSAIATEASVPALAEMLTQGEMAEMARYALSRIPGPAADEALRKALDTTTGKNRIGILNSIGQRRDAKAVPTLRGLISSPDAGVADAAISALANIADRAALDSLAAARKRISGAKRERVSNAYLRGAANLAERGDRNGALRIYQQLSMPAEPDTIRIAALSGLAPLQGKDAVAVLAEEIGSKSPAVQAAAIGLLAGIPGPDATVAMIRKLPNLAPGGQARLITALSLRGDFSARPVVLQSTRSNEAEVRVAALTGLGKLGDESSVPVLAAAAAEGQAAEQAAARESLANLRGPKLDSTIVAAIASSTGKVKTELILVAGERRSAGAGDALVKAARENDPELRRSALRALKNVGGPQQVSALVDLVQAVPPADLRDATQALAAALKRSQGEQIAGVISAYNATSLVERRLPLLDALGQTAHAEVLPVLRSGLKDHSPEIVRTAILALTDWPDPTPSADMFGLAASGSNPALRTLALRGYLKLLALPAQRSNPETVSLLGKAIRFANEPAEKRTVLSLLVAYPCDEALKLAEELFKDPAVATEAKVSFDRISNALRRK
jgi:HEAT repeat protein